MAVERIYYDKIQELYAVNEQLKEQRDTMFNMIKSMNDLDDNFKIIFNDLAKKYEVQKKRLDDMLNHDLHMINGSSILMGNNIEKLSGGHNIFLTSTPIKTISFYKRCAEIDKITWRFKSEESVRTTRWNRNHTKIAEFYYFWEIECRNYPMYIPLKERYDWEAISEEIHLKQLEFREPTYD